MSLSCSYDYDPEPGDVCWDHPANFTPLTTKRSRKCASCGTKITPGTQSLRFRRWKVPDHDIELAIYGEDGDQGPPRASLYHCLNCGLIYQLLASFEYAIQITDNMSDLFKEHVDTDQRGCG